MKGGAENRRKTLIAGGLGAVALICIGYAYTALFGGNTPATPPPNIAPVGQPLMRPGINAPIGGAPAAPGSAANAPQATVGTGLGPSAAGVGARRLATASASLDPTLDESAMLRTERLVYTGTGRNIFSALYTPPVAKSALPKPIAPIRPQPTGPPAPPPAPPTCPPSCPPINLRFFGTAQHGNGPRQAFLLQGDDVFLASEGEIVARRYKIVSITANTVRVEDLSNTDVQTLPLQTN